MAEPATENATTSRKEKRKASKKAKRQLLRRQMAADDHALLSDPAELLRLRSAELDEAERSLRERTLWEEREKAWLTNLDDQRRLAAETREPPTEKTDGDDDDGGWEFVEVGPPEIVWQGNEIILKKKKIRVPKTDSPKPKDAERPISNPLPPEPDRNSSSVSGHNSIETVAQQVPNFGTEQDKAHCPFHLKTGVCRFGQRCSRVHFYPDKSCTLLIKNMYNGPGLAWEQDEGLEYTDEEVERSYEEFYEDVHTEFLKFGEIVNFKVCRNGSFHLRGNVYVHFKALDSAVLAYRFINARYFAGKQVSCEFVNVTRWKVAICGEYMKTRFKTCSRGTACNFIHCFRNPGGEYEWSDNDKPPPRYWVKKMIALFGYSDESAHEQQTAQDNWDQPNSSGKTSTADVDRHHSRRSKSRETDYLYHSSSGRRKDNEDYVPRRRDQLQYTSNDKEKTGTLKENMDVDRVDLKDYHQRKRKIHHFDAVESYDDDRDRETCHDGYRGHTRKSSRSSSRNDKNDFHESGSGGDWLGRDSEKESCHNYSRKSSKYQNKTEKQDDHGCHESKTHEVDKDGRGKERVEEKYRDTRKYSSRHSGKDKNRERTGRERDVDRHSRRKSSVSYRKFDGFSKLYSGERNPVETTEVETDPNEKSDFSEGSELANRSNAAADHSHKGIGKLHSYDGDLRTDKSNDSSGSSKDGEQCRVYDLDSRCKYDVEIDKHDRWEPEPEPEPAFL